MRTKQLAFGCIGSIWWYQWSRKEIFTHAHSFVEHTELKSNIKHGFTTLSHFKYFDRFWMHVCRCRPSVLMHEWFIETTGLTFQEEIQSMKMLPHHHHHYQYHCRSRRRLRHQFYNRVVFTWMNGSARDFPFVLLLSRQNEWVLDQCLARWIEILWRSSVHACACVLFYTQNSSIVQMEDWAFKMFVCVCCECVNKSSRDKVVCFRMCASMGWTFINTDTCMTPPTDHNKTTFLNTPYTTALAYADEQEHV